MKTLNDKINLNLDEGAEVSITGVIAPIEHMTPNFHEEWDALANMRVAEEARPHSTYDWQTPPWHIEE